MDPSAPRPHDRYVLFVPSFKPFYFPERAGAERYARNYFRLLDCAIEDLRTRARWERAGRSDAWREVRAGDEGLEPYWNR